MCALEDVYPDGYGDTMSFLAANGRSKPKAADYGIGERDVPKMVKTALGMGKTLAQLLRRKLARKGDAGIHRRNL